MISLQWGVLLEKNHWSEMVRETHSSITLSARGMR